MRKIIISHLYTRNDRLKALEMAYKYYMDLFKVEYIPASVLVCRKDVIKKINEGNTENIVVTEREIYLSDNFNGVGYYKADKDGDICTYLNGIEAINDYLKYLKGE